MTILCFFGFVFRKGDRRLETLDLAIQPTASPRVQVPSLVAARVVSGGYAEAGSSGRPPVLPT